MSEKPDFYPTVEDYNADQYDNEPVTLENLDYLIYKIKARTGLSYDQISFVVKIYFNEIRSEVLKGKNVYLGNIGKLYCKLIPNKRSKYKFNIRLAFKASKQLIKKVKYNAIIR